MRPQFEPIQIRPPEPPGNSGKVLLLLMVTLGILSVGGYLVFVPEVTDRLPFELNAATASIAQHGERLSPSAQDDSKQRNDLTAPRTGDHKEPTEIVGTTNAGDNLERILTSTVSEKSLSLASRASQVLATRIKQNGKDVRSHLSPLPKDLQYSLILDREGNFLAATLVFDPGSVFHVAVERDDLRAWREDAVIDYKIESRTFRIGHGQSLYGVVLGSGEGLTLVHKIKNVFQYDIDFISECRPGDTCTVLFERRYADDRPEDYGEILAAVYNGKRTGRKTAFRFGDVYYDEHGVELKKSLLVSPLKTLRVTSGFGMRKHPIFKKWRMHKGVDYGAPHGTPVYSVASGTVIFAGWAKGYGKYVKIRHKLDGKEYVSGYGHLSKYFVRKGQRIKQGHRIGNVGSTGDSTGPHLDFQLVKNGKHFDPQEAVKKIKSRKKVVAPLRPRFQQVVQKRGNAMGLTRLGENLDDRVRTARLR